MLPLQGIRVIEIAQNLAGPYCGEILGTMGADVIKIERPEGDDARGWGPPFLNGTSVSFQSINHDKHGIALDLKDPAAVAWLKAYLAGADVLVQNLRPGVLDELGLGPDVLLAANPRLVCCSLWAFGNTGPMKLHPGYEPMIQAFSGMFSVNGTEDGPPARVGMQVLDMGTGLWAALGCVAALYRRNVTGRGGVVDASLFETALGWLGMILTGFVVTKQQPPRHRSGNARVVVFQSFETADGEVVVAAANDRLFAKLAAVVGPETVFQGTIDRAPPRVGWFVQMLPPDVQHMIARPSGQLVGCKRVYFNERIVVPGQPLVVGGRASPGPHGLSLSPSHGDPVVFALGTVASERARVAKLPVAGEAFGAFFGGVIACALVEMVASMLAR